MIEIYDPKTIREATEQVKMCYQGFMRTEEDPEARHAWEDDAMAHLISALLKRMKGMPISPELRRAIEVVKEMNGTDYTRWLA